MEELFNISLYLYDSSKENGLGTEIPNVLIGGKITTCLDDTLDTAEISVNLSDRKAPYKPLTKMVLVLSKGTNAKYFHYEVRSDLVEKESKTEEKYKHTLFLGNPAISCQKRTCDNFSISYRLQDVTLEADKFSDSLVVNPSINGSVASNDKYYLPNSGYALVDECETFNNGPQVKSAVVQRMSKVFEWAQYDWTHDIKLYNSKLIKTDYRLAATTNFKTNLENMHYYSLYDKASGGLNQDTIDRINKWMYAYHSDKKIQVVNYQSGKNYSTTINDQTVSYFEKNTVVSGSTMSFVVPQLLAYNSIPNHGNTNIDKSESDYVMLPTLTTIRKTNKTTGETTITYYVSAYGTQNKNTLTEGCYKWRKNSSSPTNAMVYSTYLKNEYMSTNKFIDSISNNAIVTSMFSYTNPTTGKVDVVHAPVYINAYETFSKCNNVIDITIEDNYLYEIEVKGYFGEQNQPENYNGPKIERYGVYTSTGYQVTSSTLNCELVNVSSMLVDNFITAAEFTQVTYNTSNSKTNATYYSTKVSGDDFKWTMAFETINTEVGGKISILKQYSTKPTCYDLFMKAQICSQTKTFDKGDKWTDLANKMPYTTDFESEMKEKTIIEDTYQNKNLWEIFMQIGKYLHAKPYIEFKDDRYNLSFKKYGASEQHTDSATKDSLFSSYDIESYCSSLDNYIENYFEYGNEIEEYIRPTDNDGTSVCSTDNAVFKTKYAIMEIVKFGLLKDGVVYDMTDFVYEHNIYKLLPILSKSAETIGSSSYSHYRGNSIYYHKYGTQIMGLQYKEPSVNSDKPYAIKQAIYTVLANNGALGSITDVSKVHINDFMYRIVYRTRDDARFKNFKPDLRKFIRNASNDLYPVQTQFNNQLDKIVDSAKYGNNIYGTLLRSGNEQLNYSEHIEDLASIKESGDLYNINDNLYYVVKNTMVVYPNTIACEIEYSKDYNKLSEIIGIDSEPRFYEIAEDKSIKRNISIDNFFFVSEECDAHTNVVNDYDTVVLWYMAPDNQYYMQPNYVVTKFSNVGSNTETKDFSKVVITPCICYANGATLTIEWDMQDNFGAGDYQKDVSSEYAALYKNSSYLAQIFSSFGISYSSTGETTFTTASSVQYCDMFGKCDIMNFFFFNSELEYNYAHGTMPKIKDYSSFIQNMPDIDTNSEPFLSLASYSVGSYFPEDDYYYNIYTEKKYFMENNVGYVIDKDARETIGVNVSYHLITSSDRIILANGIWRKKLNENGECATFYLAALRDEVSKYAKDTILNQIIEYVQIDLSPKPTDTFYLNFAPKLLTDASLTNAKSIAIIYNVKTLYQFNFVIARNVDGLTLSDKKKGLNIYRVTNENYFSTKED